MHSSGVPRIVLICVIVVSCFQTLASKRITITTLTGFEEYYDNLTKACKTVGFVKRHCHIGRGAGTVAFTAVMTQHQTNLRKGALVKFPKIIVNEGRGYDGQYSVFTAPINGVYVFEWTITTQKKKYFHTTLHANGKDVINLPCNPTVSYHTCSATAIVKMKKGDKAWIFHSHNNNAYGTLLASHFSGYRL